MLLQRKQLTADSIVGWRAKMWNEDVNGDVIDEEVNDLDCDEETTVESDDLRTLEYRKNSYLCIL